MRSTRPLFQKALLAVLVLVAPVASCHRAPKPKPKVLTSIFPVYDLTRRIAGDDADVVLIVPPERSPHQFTPTPGDVERAAGASLGVMIGLDLDVWMESLVTAHGKPKAHVLRLADRVPTLPRKPSLTEETTQAKRDAARRPGDPDPRGAESIDVHVWLDPQRALLMERAITDELSRVDPDHAKDYRTRGLALTHAIEALDKELEDRTAAFKQRSFATLHDSFRYYAGRYHLDVVASVEEHAGVRPSIRYEQMVLGRMRERGAKAVFGETQLDSQPSHTLAQAGPFPYGILDPLGGTGAATSYEALLRQDTDVLEKALNGPQPSPDAPPAIDGGANPPQ